MKLYKVFTGNKDGERWIYYLVRAETPEVANIKAREIAEMNPYKSWPFYDPIMAYIEEVQT